MDALNASWPFTRLIIDPQQIQLNTMFLKDFSLPKSNITSISKYSGFFSNGIRIEHRIADFPPFIVFWTRKLEAISSALTQNGYILVADK
jgi:hypothetical protein